MRILPLINRRYWVLLSAASIFGTNTGDFLSDQLHLGHLLGLPVLLALLALIFLAERFSPRPSIGFFWAAIITIRTAATNIGDAFRDHGLGFEVSLPLITVCMIASVLLYRAITPPAPGNTPPTIQATPVYWLCMLLAGALGTLCGDFASFVLGLGTLGASLALSVLALACIVLYRRPATPSVPRYWLSVWSVRSAGTAIGDFLANECWTLGASTAVTGLVFVALTVGLNRPAAPRAGRINAAR